MSRQPQRGFDLGDYIDVPARIAEFRTKHPDGSLQPADLARPFEVREIAGQTYIVVVAAAYRAPDDPRPGIGMAYEVYPGQTPYTKGSELQNAETSAWGRAIVAALAADTKRGIASAEEVRNRQAERQPHIPTEQMRQNILANAHKAIADTADQDGLDAIGRRISDYEQRGQLTGADAVELRRALVARIDELFPAGERAVTGEWPETAQVGEAS